MSYFTENLHEYCEGVLEGLQRNNTSWLAGRVPFDGVINITYSAATKYERLATSAALLGASRQSREWFGEAAQCHLEKLRASRLLRDVRERGIWKNEPRTCFHALIAALVSHDDAILAEVANATLLMDESYLDVFAAEYPDSPARFWDVKVRAALSLGDERAATFLEELRTALDVPMEKSQWWEALLAYYQALVDGSRSATQRAIEDLFDHYAYEEYHDPDTPREYVLYDVCAHIVLARRLGIDISLESDRLPAALFEADIPEDDNELDLGIDLDDLKFTSDVGLFELERDENDTPVIAGRIYHPGGEPVTAADVPEREAGRVLSDAWVEAALAEAEWRDHYDDDLVADATAAFEDGSLQRKLVVVQDRIDEHLFDESLTDLPVDDVELLKGAGRRS